MMERTENVTSVLLKIQMKGTRKVKGRRNVKVMRTLKVMRTPVQIPNFQKESSYLLTYSYCHFCLCAPKFLLTNITFKIRFMMSSQHTILRKFLLTNIAFKICFMMSLQHTGKEKRNLP